MKDATTVSVWVTIDPSELNPSHPEESLCPYQWESIHILQYHNSRLLPLVDL